ncbi:hypothetical protein ACFQ9R_16585 [Nocardia sp. NPDC056541]|uniref:hypothetical protein n=1 Tax=Nocardia sp. NPDC056541 TaxID=3345860 RepID=UPI0036708305
MLWRRCAVAAAVMIGLTACQEELPGHRPVTPIEAASAMPAYWKTAPTSDDQRLELLRRLRAIDPCALIPRTDLAKIGTLLAVENDGPNKCEATFDSTESGKGTSVSWAIGVAPTGYGWGQSRREEVDGITVGVLRDLDNGPQVEGQLDRSCLATAAFANTTTLPVHVRTPLGTEPCPAAQSALARAMGGLAAEPAQGTSPDTPRTALHGKDPCEVATALDTAVTVLDLRIWSCQFTFRGAAIDVDYGYEARGYADTGKSLFTVNGHTGYGPSDDTSEYVSYTAIVGPSLPGPGSELMGPAVPTIRVFGTDRAALESVLRSTTELFPAT